MIFRTPTEIEIESLLYQIIGYVSVMKDCEGLKKMTARLDTLLESEAIISDATCTKDETEDQNERN